MKQLRIAALVLPLLAAGCYPVVRFEGEITVEGQPALQPDRLHLSIWSQRTDRESYPPTAFTLDLAIDPTSIEKKGGALQYSWTELGGAATVDIQFWYDADGDGQVGVGDRVGRLPAPVEGRDRGLLSGNLTTIAPIHLTEAPDSDDWGQWPEVDAVAEPQPPQG